MIHILSDHIQFIIMLRLSKPIGFIIGIGLGIYTRDSYVYPYPLRVQDLQ